MIVEIQQMSWSEDVVNTVMNESRQYAAFQTCWAPTFADNEEKQAGIEIT